MKKVLISTFAFLMVCFMFMSQSLLANEETLPKNSKQINEVKLQAETKEFSEAGLFPFFGDNSGFTMEINKSQLLYITIILSVTLLVFAHKNNFETDIYAFYHSDRNGGITFGSIEEQQAFEFRGFLAKTFRILGILTAFASVIMIII
ncbi:hypothetical protein [Cognataquiflexum rubidum]|uniref:hypothetical protein n=1 Tax=Cognataquiflexum rubidum TaxID=2922273 RepID=UPI001F13E351|nr:hypothetical protein [Cognataquiflexum rubidum]MCH6236431.1 hypothetical protein [Cognataquiflexum rubidum]